MPRRIAANRTDIYIALTRSILKMGAKIAVNMASGMSRSNRVVNNPSITEPESTRAH